MRILIICPHFEPDTAPTGVIISEITRELATLGHKIDVITTLPWYENHSVEPSWRGSIWRKETTSWGKITRLYPFPTSKTNILARALGYSAHSMLASVFGLFGVKQPEVVLVMSPPLTLGPVGWLAARFHRSALVLNVQDVFPDVAVVAGSISNTTFIKCLHWLERFLYRRCEVVTVLSRDIRKNIEAKIAPKEPASTTATDEEGGPAVAGAIKTLWRRAMNAIRGTTRVEVIPNFVDTKKIQPMAKHNSYRQEFGLGDRFVVMYAGNLGFSQPLELMIEAGRELAHRQDIVFVLNGDGARRKQLEELAKGLPNVVFVGYQARERLEEVLAASDVQVIALRAGLGSASVPSKFFSILAASRPVLAALDGDSEMARIVSEHQVGKVVSPDSQEAFTNAVLELADNSDLTAMGLAGREVVLGLPTPEKVAGLYGQLFRGLARPD